MSKTWTEDEYAERGYTRLNLRLLEAQRERLERLAAKTSETMNVLLGRLIDQEFEKMFRK